MKYLIAKNHVKYRVLILLVLRSTHCKHEARAG